MNSRHPSWPPARVEGRVLATVSGPLPADLANPANPAQSSEKRVFAVKTNDLGKILGKNDPQKRPQAGLGLGPALGRARAWARPWAGPRLGLIALVLMSRQYCA